jgi:hypothetical protein
VLLVDDAARMHFLFVRMLRHRRKREPNRLLGLLGVMNIFGEQSVYPRVRYAVAQSHPPTRCVNCEPRVHSVILLNSYVIIYHRTRKPCRHELRRGRVKRGAPTPDLPTPLVDWLGEGESFFGGLWFVG